MTIEQLGFILEIQKCKSINKAAKNLFVSQPCLSGVLKNFEAELGYQIFERTSTGIKTTEQGESFLLFADRMYSQYNMLRRTPSPTFEDNTLSITSACSSLYSHTYFQFLREHPAEDGYPSTFREATIYPSLQDLTTHQTRMVITYLSQSNMKKYESYAHKNDLNLFILKKDLPVRAIVPEDHELAACESVDADTLINYPFVAYTGVDHEDMVDGVGSGMAKVQFVSSRASFYDAVRMGGCVSTSLDVAPGEEKRYGFLCKPCHNMDDRFVATAFVNSQYEMNTREKQFLNYLTAKLESLPRQ